MRLAALILRLVYLLRERRFRESRDSNYSPSRDTSFPREFFNKSFCKANRLITRRTFTLSRASRVKSINLIAKSATRVNFFQLLRERENTRSRKESSSFQSRFLSAKERRAIRSDFSISKETSRSGEGVETRRAGRLTRLSFSW